MSKGPSLIDVALSGHSRDCGYHLDQYPWECDCGRLIDFDRLVAEAQRMKEDRYGGLPRDIWERYVRPFEDALKTVRILERHVFGSHS